MHTRRGRSSDEQQRWNAHDARWALERMEGDDCREDGGRLQEDGGEDLATRWSCSAEKPAADSSHTGACSAWGVRRTRGCEGVRVARWPPMRAWFSMRACASSGVVGCYAPLQLFASETVLVMLQPETSSATDCGSRDNSVSICSQKTGVSFLIHSLCL